MNRQIYLLKNDPVRQRYFLKKLSMRILLSIVLGIVFPIISLIVLAFISEYLPPSALVLIRIYDQPAPGILFAPFSMPMYFSIFVKYHRVMPFIFDTFLFRLLSSILFNWTLYGTIFYFLLGFLPRFKKQKISYSETPPSPPEF